MKIIFISDQHGNLQNLLNLLQYCEITYNPDIYIQVGDLTNRFTEMQFYDKLNDYLQKINKVLYFIDGNHDNHSFLKSYVTNEYSPTEIRQNIIYLPRGSRLTFKDKTFFFCGGGFTLNQNHKIFNRKYWNQKWLQQKEVKDILNYYEDKTMKADYFIAHDTLLHFDKLLTSINPIAYLIAGFADRKHKKLLKKLVVNTEATTIIHGHYHIPKKQTIDGYYDIALGTDNMPFEQQIYLLKI